MKRNKPYRVGDRLAINEPYLAAHENAGTFVIGVHPGRGCRTAREYAEMLAGLISHIAIDVEPPVEPMTVWGWVSHARRRGDVTWRAATPGIFEAAPDEAGVIVFPGGKRTNNFVLSCGARGWANAALEPWARLVAAAVAAVAARLDTPQDRVWYWLERCWRESNATACNAADFFRSLPEAALP